MEEFDQLSWIANWECVQHQAVRHSEDRGVSANAKSECEDGDYRESRRFAEYAEPVANILNEVLNPGYASRLAAFLFGLLNTAQRQPLRRASSCVIPCAAYSSVFRSRWSRSSASSSWSTCVPRNNDRNRSGIVYSQCLTRISNLRFGAHNAHASFSLIAREIVRETPTPTRLSICINASLCCQRQHGIIRISERSLDRPSMPVAPAATQQAVRWQPRRWLPP